MEETQENQENNRGFIPANDTSTIEVIKNKGGRPKGRFTIKGKIIKFLEERPDLLQDMVEHLIKNEPALILQMVDGRPSQSIEGTVNVLPFNFIIEKAEPNKLQIESTPTQLISETSS